MKNDIKITKVEAISYRLPTRREFRWAGLQESIGGFVCARIETNTGLVGYGEATPLPDWGGDYHRHCGETMASVHYLIESVMGPLLIGKDPTNIVQAHETMNYYVRGNTYAKAAIDIALYDIWGKVTNQPIYKLLGGKVRDEVKVGHMIGIMSLEESRKEARGAYEDGIRAFQIKTGEDFERDVAVIKMLREEFGDSVWLRLDANKGYKDVKTALYLLNKMVDKDGKPLLDMVEQPVEGFKDMAVMTDKLSIKTIVDESVWNLADAFEAVSHRDTYHLPCDTNGSLESAIGTAANVHFVLSQPAATLPSIISINAPAGKHPYKFGGHFYDDDICVEPFKVKDGCILPFEGPGLGIEVDEDKLNKYRIQ